MRSGTPAAAMKRGACSTKRSSIYDPANGTWKPSCSAGAATLNSIKATSMSILPAKSIDDFNSLNYMRKQSIWTLRMRRFLQRLFGPPQNAADDAPHGLSPKGMSPCVCWLGFWLLNSAGWVRPDPLAALPFTELKCSYDRFNLHNSYRRYIPDSCFHSHSWRSR